MCRAAVRLSRYRTWQSSWAMTVSNCASVRLSAIFPAAEGPDGRAERRMLRLRRSERLPQFPRVNGIAANPQKKTFANSHRLKEGCLMPDGREERIEREARI